MNSFKTYFKSSVITFIAAFAMAVLPGLGNVDFSKGALVAIVMVGIRAGVKALLEYFAILKA